MTALSWLCAILTAVILALGWKWASTQHIAHPSQTCTPAQIRQVVQNQTYRPDGYALAMDKYCTTTKG